LDREQGGREAPELEPPEGDMIEPGAVLDAQKLGVRIEIRATAASTGGEYVEFDVVGRARGLVAQPHIHEAQVERHEVIEGAMRLTIAGKEHLLRPGDAMEVPAGVSHRQRPGRGSGVGRVRVRLTPAGRTEAFLERLSELSGGGGLNRFGLPTPLAAARLVQDFEDEGRATYPPPRVQRALARGLLATFRPYAFADEWDVDAPRDAVFAALADAESYPRWWRPVYLSVHSGGKPAVGTRSSQHFKGRLPYHLHTSSVITRYEPPSVLEADVTGDLRGRGTWTLTDRIGGGTHVRFDWVVHADRPLLRALTPVLRPALRWNHAWAMARAVEGLEPYARSIARESKVGLAA
jgi:uncharacterized protein YndB with AHSA1/START domain/mannose-6-phosphate isomerase-like protein (cupin superfamily)